MADAGNWFKFEGVRVFYERRGQGERILFLPNATLTSRLWEHQLEHFARTHDVLAVDLPGFGRSDPLPDGPSLGFWIRWLERFMDELHLAPAALVGNCIGSLLALHHAARHPHDVSVMVLMNTLDSVVGVAGPMRRGTGLLKWRALRPLLEWAVVHMPVRLALRHPYPHLQLGDLSSNRTSAYHEHAIEWFSRPQTRLALVRLAYDMDNHVFPIWNPEAGERPPVCWIWGEANRLLPVEVGMRQIQQLKPDEVHVLKQLGYAAAWEAPDEVNRIIERFLDRGRDDAAPRCSATPQVASHRAAIPAL